MDLDIQDLFSNKKQDSSFPRDKTRDVRRCDLLPFKPELNKSLTSTDFTIDRSGFSSGPIITNFLTEESDPASNFNEASKLRGRPLNTSGLFAVRNFRKTSMVSLGPEPGRFNTEPNATFRASFPFTGVIVGSWDNVKPSPCFT